MENNENSKEGTTQRVDSVDASKILNSSGGQKKTSVDPSKGESSATLSMIFGIVSIVGGFGGFLSLGFAIAGLILAKQAKGEGYEGTYQKVGFYTSVIGIILAAVSFLVIVGMLVFFGASFVLSFFLSIVAIFAEAARSAHHVVGFFI